jgi:outer membrane biogenesis lipoprotein LolB
MSANPRLTTSSCTYTALAMHQAPAPHHFVCCYACCLLLACSLAAQVVVHNLPWTTTWQQLKDAFKEWKVERADVVYDSWGKSRWVRWWC